MTKCNDKPVFRSTDSGTTKRSRLDNDRGIKIVFTVLFAIYALCLIIPFVWILLNSFKNGMEEYVTDNTWALPKEWKFSNYYYVFKLSEIDESLSFFGMFMNSIILCLICPTMGAISTTLAAYVMSKFKFKGKKLIFVIFLIPMIVSIAGTQTALMSLWDNLNWFDMPFLGITIMSCCGTGMNFFLLLAIFNSTSNTYMEAARIDGAGELRIFGQVMLPHAMGVIGTTWVLGFIGTWNDYGTAKLFLEPTFQYNIALGIQKIQEQIKSPSTDFFYVPLRDNYPLFYAAIIMSLIPVIIVFLVFQKQIMKLSLGGGIK